MKKIMFFIVFVAIISSVFSYFNCAPRVIISNLLKQGEIRDGDLQYRFYLFGAIPVANATLRKAVIEEFNGNKVYSISAVAENTKLTIPVFSGAAFLDSYLDIQSKNPVFFKQLLAVKGKDEVVREVAYDQKQGVMTISGVKRSILPDTQDPLSAIFNIRQLDLGKTKDFEISFNNNQKNYILSGIITQENLSVNKRIYPLATAKAEIKRRDKNPYHKSSLTIVFLKDTGNIPILINVFASGILIKAKLVRIK